MSVVIGRTGQIKCGTILCTRSLGYSSKLNFGNLFTEENIILLKGRLNNKSSVINWSPQYAKDVKFVKKAAVLIPLCLVDGVPSVLFTLRSSNLKNHGGQVSFPGGMEDKSDPSLTYTALRETEEEIGLKRENVEIWGQLPPLPNKTFDTLIHPLISFCGSIQIDSLSINHQEVVEVFSSSLESLCSKQNVTYSIYTTSTAKYQLPNFINQKHRIWGITALMLYQTLQILIPELFTHTFKDSKVDGVQNI